MKAHKVVSKITHLVFVYVTEDQTEIEINKQTKKNFTNTLNEGTPLNHCLLACI